MSSMADSRGSMPRENVRGSMPREDIGSMSEILYSNESNVASDSRASATSLSSLGAEASSQWGSGTLHKYMRHKVYGHLMNQSAHFSSRVSHTRLGTLCVISMFLSTPRRKTKTAMVYVSLSTSNVDAANASTASLA